jgi:hypothetical protein
MTLAIARAAALRLSSERLDGGGRSSTGRESFGEDCRSPISADARAVTLQGSAANVPSDDGTSMPAVGSSEMGACFAAIAPAKRGFFRKL